MAKEKRNKEEQSENARQLHSGRKLLPTDFLYFQITFVKTYRYRYRSVIILN